MAILKTVLVGFLIVSLSFPAMAQQPQPTAGQSSFSGPKRQMATIIFAGLGGAILGLSTLSFYGRPQDNLANIAIGFGVGVITGTVVMTYRAATNPREFYANAPLETLPQWERESLLRERSAQQVSVAQWSLSF